MKILLVSDIEDPYLWEFYKPGRLDPYDLILCAGDLKAEYLTFLVTMSHAQVLYIHGNHDERYAKRPPEGCVCIDDTLVTVCGLRIAGLGGSARYREGPYQYTEAEMTRRIRRVNRKVRRAGGVDIVLTHAAPKGCGDAEGYAHRGFACFLPMLDRWKPKYLVHGHVHLQYGVDRLHAYGETQVVNACQKYVLDWPEEDEE
ncbi:MAG: metallophosphoesterase family protein [Clostridia bacterium]|nr:metallophosphoesterase family protein [Clostridia bacterium]